MIGGDTQVARPFLDHLQDPVEHTHDRAHRPILALGETAQTVKVPEQLVGAVDEMDDHAGILRGCNARLQRWSLNTLPSFITKETLPGSAN